MMPVLVIDMGNSRTKWGVYDGSWLAQGVVENARIADLADQLQPWSNCKQAAVSSVADTVEGVQLELVLGQLGIPSIFMDAQPASCGVTNGYVDFSQLGSDRWAAVVAAWNLHHVPCVVATAGTALTVDVLSGKGEFLGGLIIPGLKAMKQVIAASTAKVGVTDGHLMDFPDNTGDAVYTGALCAMAGSIEMMRAKLQAREGVVPLCLLSGGDRLQLLPALSMPVELADNLVLQGLVLMAGEHE